MLRSITAVIAGYVVMALGVLVLFVIWFRDATAEPTLVFMLFSAAWGFAAAIAGGYVTGSIASRSVERHLVALVGFGFLMKLLSILVAPAGEPLWYQVTSLVVMVIGVALGGRLLLQFQSPPARSGGGAGFLGGRLAR